jgi:hypothetical protein
LIRCIVSRLMTALNLRHFGLGEPGTSANGTTMKDAGKTRERSKAIIRSACGMLRGTRENAPVFVRDPHGASADLYMLLQDATKIFCRAISELRGEAPDLRWTPALPELLLAYPERCDETLALIESDRYHEVNYFHSAAV